jgi:hypothetical protein
MSDHVYARIDNATGDLEVRHQKPERPVAPGGKRWIDDIPPDHDSDTHRLEEVKPVPANATKVPYSIVERDLGAEAADVQHTEDLTFLELNARQQAMYVLVELVAKLSADDTIDINDFTAEAKQAYLGLKERVDRLTVS